VFAPLFGLRRILDAAAVAVGKGRSGQAKHGGKGNGATGEASEFVFHDGIPADSAAGLILPEFSRIQFEISRFHLYPLTNVLVQQHFGLQRFLMRHLA
jgi:hypothetical protein